MGQIRPYIAQVSPQGEIPSRNAQPSDITGPGVENLGQAMTQAGGSFAHAQQLLQHQEDRNAVTKLHVAFAELSRTHTRQIAEQQAQAKPDNTDFFGTVYRGEGIPEGEEPTPGSIQSDLNALGGQLTNPVAQQRFKTIAAEYTTNVLHQSIAFQGHLAKTYATTQAKALVDSYAGQTQIDPAQHAYAVKAFTQAIDDPASQYYNIGMTAGAREEIKRQGLAEITGGTVRGYIAVAPEYALKQLQAGAWEGLTSEQRVVLTGAAETQIRGLDIEARRVEAEQVRKQKVHSDNLDSMLSEKEMLSHDATSNTKPVGWNDVLEASASGMEPEKVRVWMGKLEERTHRLNTGEVKTDIGTKLKLFKGIGDGTVTNTAPIDDAYMKRQLSDSDHDWLLKKAYERKSPDGDKLSTDFQAFYKRVPEQLILQPNILTGAYFNQENGAYYDQYLAEVERRKLLKLQKKEDPRDLITPGHKDYVGTQEFLSTYTKHERGVWPTYAPPQPVPGAPPRKSLDEIFGMKK